MSDLVGGRKNTLENGEKEVWRGAGRGGGDIRVAALVGGRRRGGKGKDGSLNGKKAGDRLGELSYFERTAILL